MTRGFSFVLVGWIVQQLYIIAEKEKGIAPL
jgi:hypothetical protein